MYPKEIVAKKHIIVALAPNLYVTVAMDMHFDSRIAQRKIKTKRNKL
jgi:hypothetical protein